MENLVIHFQFSNIKRNIFMNFKLQNNLKLLDNFYTTNLNVYLNILRSIVDHILNWVLVHELTSPDNYVFNYIIILWLLIYLICFCIGKHYLFNIIIIL
jgi:hypothetical protein